MRNEIYCDGQVIPLAENIDELFLNKLTIFYGASGTGKSSLIKHILNELHNEIPVAIVCCPTNDLNQDYSGIFPDQCIHSDLTKELLQKIFSRQTAIMSMYQLVRATENLLPLFDLIASATDREKIEKLTSILTEAITKIKNKHDADEAEMRIGNIKKQYNKKVVKKLRETISENLSLLLNEFKLNDMQKLILANFNINPNLLLLVDDCAASIKEWRDLKETKELFFQGRHFGVTVLFTMQNESIIPPQFRQNAHISAFMTEKIVNTYFAKASTGVPIEERKLVARIAKVIFADSGNFNKPNYKKLLMFGPIVKTNHRFQYIIGSNRAKKFGSEAFWKMCNTVKKNDTVATSTAFNKIFNIKPSPKLDDC
jgi:ABC-type ATPase involved in cell division